jgi:hypothetical protein
MLTKTKGAALSTRRPSANRSENNHDLIRGASAVFKAVFADKPAPAAIVAELVGADTVICTGKTTVSPTPILDLCRELIAEGFDAKASLMAYRNGVPAVTVTAIGKAAMLRIRGNGIGFEKLTRPTAPPVRQNGKPATGVPAARRANQRGSAS